MISMKVVFSLFTMVVVVLTVAGVFTLTDRNARRALQVEMETRLVLEARHLALLSVDALLGEFPELTLCPLTREMLQRRPDLEIVVVLDHAGTIMGHPDIRLLGERFSVLKDFLPRATLAVIDADETILASAQHLAARVPARHPSGQVVGSVVVGQSRAHLDSMLRAGRGPVLLLAAALATISVLLALLVVHRLLAPLDVLRAGLQRIGRGDLDTPIKLRNRTELGLLARTIDTMAVQIKRSRRETQARRSSRAVRTRPATTSTAWPRAPRGWPGWPACRRPNANCCAWPRRCTTPARSASPIRCSTSRASSPTRNST